MKMPIAISKWSRQVPYNWSNVINDFVPVGKLFTFCTTMSFEIVKFRLKLFHINHTLITDFAKKLSVFDGILHQRLNLVYFTWHITECFYVCFLQKCLHLKLLHGFSDQRHSSLELDIVSITHNCIKKTPGPEISSSTKISLTPLVSKHKPRQFRITFS